MKEPSKTSKRETRIAKPVDAKRENIRLDITALQLFASKLNKTYPDRSDDEELGKASHTISCVVNNVSTTDKAVIGFVDLSVERKGGSSPHVEIAASYLFVAKPILGKPEPEELRNAIEYFVHLGVWPTFKDLFAFTVNQANLDFPMLPMKPPSVTHRD